MKRLLAIFLAIPFFAMLRLRVGRCSLPQLALTILGTHEGEEDVFEATFCHILQPRRRCEPAGRDQRGVSARFVQRKDAALAGLTYTVEFSADVTTWSASVTAPTVLADDGTYQIMGVPYPPLVNGAQARFSRVRVTLAP